MSFVVERGEIGGVLRRTWGDFMRWRHGYRLEVNVGLE